MSLFIRNENWGTYLRLYPITALFLSINLILFLLMTIAGGSTQSRILLQFGAYFKPAILQGEWYRLIVPVFLHMGWEHILFNNFAIYLFAPGLELMIGKIRFLLLYILSGIAGFISTFFLSSQDVLAVGASGSIFGIYGMFAFLLLNRKTRLDRISRQTIAPIIVFGIISTFVIPGISIVGHFGGLVCGYLLGYVFIKH